MLTIKGSGSKLVNFKQVPETSIRRGVQGKLRYSTHWPDWVKYGHYNGLVARIGEDLTLNDVDYINMDLPSARAALLSGRVDVATLAGNNAIMVKKAGGKILANGEGFIKPTTLIAACSPSS